TTDSSPRPYAAESNHRYASSNTAEATAKAIAATLIEGLPIANQAIATGTVMISTASTVPRWNVVSGSPLTFTSTFHVPCTTAAASARPIATGITAANVAQRRDPERSGTIRTAGA